LTTAYAFSERKIDRPSYSRTQSAVQELEDSCGSLCLSWSYCWPRLVCRICLDLIKKECIRFSRCRYGS